MELDSLRAEIDNIDSEIVALFQRRMDVSARIAEYKRAGGLPVLDEKREEQKLEGIAGACRDELRVYALELCREIMSLSRAYQTELIRRKNG